MQKRIALILALTLVFSLCLTAKETKLGGEIKIEKVTKISEILEKPEDFMDKTVRVEGYIVDGCMHHGTWIAIAGDKDFMKLDIMDKARKLKFPLDHKGKYAIVEGTVYSAQLTEKQATQWLKHLEKTHKQGIDLSKAKGGMKIYRVSPTGAVLKDKK